jgi:hypothetical protein
MAESWHSSGLTRGAESVFDTKVYQQDRIEADTCDQPRESRSVASLGILQSRWEAGQGANFHRHSTGKTSSRCGYAICLTANECR